MQGANLTVDGSDFTQPYQAVRGLGFSAQGYVVVRGLIGSELTAFFWQDVRMKVAYGLICGHDRLVPTATARYGDEAFEALLETIRPRIETETGLRLHPTYSYFRMYGRGDTLKRHHDRPASEIAVSINLGQIPATPWPLGVAGTDGDHAAHLHPGDALIYRGHALDDWREPYEGTQLAQVFLQYVDKDGPYAAQKYDGRPGLMLPKAGSSIGNQGKPEHQETGRVAALEHSALKTEV